MTDIGLGFGQDYGGYLGIKGSFSPHKHFAIFGAAGLFITGFGWQVGGIGYLIPKTSKRGFRPNVKVMYGVNNEIYVQNLPKYDELYNGFTVSVGMELRFGRAKKHGLNADLGYPIRTKEYMDDWDVVLNDPNVESSGVHIPITISYGYHFEF